MNKRRQNFLAGLLGLGLVALLVYGFILHKSANINIVASPSAATMVIDGKKQVKVGKVYVSPGKHELVASFNGFATQSFAFTTTKNLTELDVILEPNSQAGYNWLASHPADTAIRQSVGGRNYNNSAQNLLKQFPIVGNLPMDGPGGEYSISYGNVSANSGRQILEIDIMYYTDAGKTAAYQWLQSQGYNMNQFNVVYVDKTSQAPVVDNPYTN